MPKTSFFPGLLPSLTRLKMLECQKARQRVAIGCSESNFSRYPIRFGQSRFVYGYQRINLSHVDPWADQPYLGLPVKRGRDCIYFTYTSCGQAAVTLGVLLAMKVYGAPVIECLDEVYFETYEAFDAYQVRSRILKLRRLGGSKSKRAPKRVLFVDSSTDWKKAFDPSEFACVVLDTTCWTLRDSELKRIVAHALDAGADVILARSHIKLDCLGTEWGRLGSVLLITRHGQDRADALTRELIRRSNPFGARAEIRQIYPFLQNRRFLQMSESWIKALRAMNRSLGSDLEEFVRENSKRLRLVEALHLFPHNLFFWVRVGIRDQTILEQKVSILVTLLRKSGIPAQQVGSYPWDFVAISPFVRVRQIPGRRSVKDGMIRVSTPDIPKKDFPKLRKVICQWLLTEFSGLPRK